MIENEIQYQITKTHAERFKAAYVNFVPIPTVHPDLSEASRQALLIMYDELLDDIKQYDWFCELNEIAHAEFGYAEDFLSGNTDCWEEYRKEGFSPREALDEDVACK